MLRYKVKPKIITMKKLLLLISAFAFIAIVTAQESKNNLDAKVADLVSELTLEEKASLCSGRDPWSTKPIERLGIPWIWMADGPHGLRRAPETHLWGYGNQLPATSFPTASALSATWDLDLVYEVGKALGRESQALDVNILLAPGINIKRSPLVGRNFEYFSEDPILAGKLGAAYVNGVQSQGVGTCVKHYVANNVETMRMYANSDVDTRTLHEIYLKPFELTIKKAEPWSIMACYNRVQGVYGTHSKYLLTDILKDKWGFEGIVISDWEAVTDRVEGIRAGMHLKMPGADHNYTDAQIVEAVENGDLNEEQLDRLVEEILKIVLKAKSLEQDDVDQNTEEHHQLARKVAAESATLLKNDNDILPIKEEKYNNIAIIGEFAVNPRIQGAGSSEVKPVKIDNALDIINAEYGQDYEIKYARGYKLTDDDDLSLVDKAKELASGSDIALVFAGLPEHFESEGRDRTHLNIPTAHSELIKEVARVQENTVVVLTNGSAIEMPWIDEVPSILETWLAGQAGAGGIADVLFGKASPSGKLAETFPVKLQDTPSYFNFPGEQSNVLYGERIFVGYRYYDKREIEPLFPFGHGLSYTTFEYNDLEVSSENVRDVDGLTVNATIKNTGDVEAKEVVQLYVTAKDPKLTSPVKELKKFTKVDLAPGESKEVSFELNSRDFAYFDAKRHMWITESGEYTIKIGASSRDIRLSETISLQSTQTVPLAYDEFTFIRTYLDNEITREKFAGLVAEWLEESTPEEEPLYEAEIDDFILDQPIIKLPMFTGGEVSKEDIMKFVENIEDLTYTP